MHESRNDKALISYDIEQKVENFHWWFVIRRNLLKSILSSLNLPAGYLAIDIGCGVGSNLKILKTAGLKRIGLDRSFYALSLARRTAMCPLINGSLDRLPIRPESFGLILAMDVLEHIENDTLGIGELYQTLKKRGILILTVPAFRFLWGTQDFATGHKRRYLRQEILNKLRKKGFEILKISYFNFFLFFPILLMRQIIHLVGLKMESENEINSSLINFFFKSIFSLEPYLLKYFSFPFGVSILCIARKR